VFREGSEYHLTDKDVSGDSSNTLPVPITAPYYLHSTKKEMC